MQSAIKNDNPVIFFEHKLLSDYWRDYLGSGGRENLDYNVPPDGEKGQVPDKWLSIPFGIAAIRRHGTDLTIVSLGVGVHRALEAAHQLEKENISVEVIDLRTIAPMDTVTIMNSVIKTGHLLVVDEDYKQFGLSGEIAALMLEKSVRLKYDRICPDQTIPYSHSREIQVIPNAQRITELALRLLKE